MRYFIDTEFIENGPRYPIELISLGIVAEDGRTLYLVSSEFNSVHASDWVKENVLPHVGYQLRNSLQQIADKVLAFVGDDKPEFWGYYAAYDWVVFCQIFGAMVHLPKGWPMYINDLKQLCKSVGNPQLPKDPAGEHNALEDALWNMKAYQFLQEVSLVRTN
jgi:3' exoribonuclease, RNase T-like